MLLQDCCYLSIILNFALVDDKFIDLSDHHDGKFTNREGMVIAYFDKRHIPVPTIRHKDCDIIIQDSGRCLACDNYRSTLHARAGQVKHCLLSGTSPSSHVNYRYLSTEE
jgi:hypothetical protein